jgi:hypothetical protein
MQIQHDQDLARGCPPSSVAAAAASLPPSSSLSPLWHNQSYKWNGFDSWSAKVEGYIKGGFVQLFSKPGFAATLAHFQGYGQSARETLSQYDDGQLVVTAGQLYSVVDLAAAFTRLKEETAFTIADFVMVVDPRAPGKGFLAMEKTDCTDGQTLEYQLLGEGADDCMRLVSEIKELLAQAKEVLQGEFFVDLDNPSHWGLTRAGISRARARLPLTQSDMIILRPIV